MAKYFAFSFLSLGAILILNSGDVTGQDQHPLILYKTSGNALRLPYDYAQRYEYEIYTQLHLFNAGTGETETQLLYCGPSTENRYAIEQIQTLAYYEDIRRNIVSKHCLFERQYSGMDAITDLVNNRNIIKCKKEEQPVPLISRILSDDNSKINCGTKDKGVLYRYGYQIWLGEELFNQVKDNLGPSLTESKVYPKTNIIDFEIYRICYDVNKQQVLYTQHRVISPKLLQHPSIIAGQQIRRTSIADNFDLQELNFRDRAQAYKNYSSNIGTSRRGQTNYRLNQLVPVTHFSFSLWQKALHHVVNNDLIHVDLFYLWNEITITCKNYAIQHEVELDIYTKTFNMPGNGTREPNIWMRIIHLGFQAVAIIANNTMDADLNVVIYATYCNEADHCKTFNPNFNGFIMCCEISEAILELFNFNPNLPIEGLLFIDGLMNNSN